MEKAEREMEVEDYVELGFETLHKKIVDEVGLFLSHPEKRRQSRIVTMLSALERCWWHVPF